MYKIHSEIVTPKRDTIIWRYLSLEKFLSLLNDKQLYFTRQDLFLDSEEAKMSTKDKQLFDKVVPGISEVMENDKFGCGFINCWVISNVELYLMWNTYSSLDKGLAIKTTIGNLIDSLDPCDEREVFISDVNYIDYYHDYTFDKTDGIANCLARYFCKRKYFLQERELRLVYYDYKATIDGDNVGQKFDVSINTLLDEVWIAPNAKGWYENLIKDEMQLHGINKPVKRSCI